MKIIELDDSGSFVSAEEIVWVKATKDPSRCEVHLKCGAKLGAYVSPGCIRAQLEKEQADEPK